ncbi:L-PSP endoribonuclease family protein [Byssothecium circinans]|uniref:L-PSP endoribonuclease family protein n=1 Tax=Byssothecium circinans TaxID=147558 RepID=A0A6A5UJI0_9PLEO|nr:L-PSP endoribonuclease family protein [Byssothecium circinans]
MSSPSPPKHRAAILSPSAPQPPPFLSQAIQQGNLVFCSGQIATNPATGTLVQGTVQDRTSQILKNLSAVLKAAGSSLDLVNKFNIFLVNPEDFAAVNETYVTFLKDPKPARTCVFVKALPMGTDVEIECIAGLESVESKL